ncbi:VPGUxxT family thioredoxin-like (seleno)protein, type 2 [Aquimarina algiphila]|uniref:VPGUxxT family thioredoxin-like (seleno)protein, type 2 n=1 Tax=Aquimarina algiphila TaxID=2047982 RepID=UPI00232D504B|nr:VPGUxxT family thioredoxin-like (seleno)protein, type 2 [Aquimarina algiphila]
MIDTFLKHALYIMLSVFCMHVSSQEKTSPKNQSIELGKVSWYRDYDTAIALAKKQKKEVLILFQEVPGCSTCRNYGHNVLSHPLMVEAIEDLFIPLAIYNNKGGKDAQILKRYNEPSWNNPVVRIVNTKGENIVKRVARNYSSIALYNAMENVLKSQKKHIPEYMKLLGSELASSQNNNIKEKYYKMYCFWTGEKHLGNAKGVLTTEPGFIGHNEVVKVKYDEQLINKNELNAYAKQVDFYPILNDGSYHIASKDRQYYLQHTDYKYLPLTELQKTKINSALGSKKSPKKYLSPKQIIWLNQINNTNTKKEVLYNKDFASAWDRKNNK